MENISDQLWKELSAAKTAIEKRRDPAPHWKRAIAELKAIQRIHQTSIRYAFARELIEHVKSPWSLGSPTTEPGPYQCYLNSGIKTLQGQGCKSIPTDLTPDDRTFQRQYGRDVVEMMKRQEINSGRGIRMTEEPKKQKRSKKKPKL
jgi:hypothetical protein